MTIDNSKISHEAIELIDQHGLDHTPRNFAVIRAYCEAHEQISEEIEHCIVGGNPLTNEICADIYLRHLSVEPGALAMDVAAELSKALSSADSNLALAGKNTAEFGNSLVKFGEQMRSVDSFGQLTDFVREIARRTQDTMVSNEQLRRELEDARNDISSLKNSMSKLSVEMYTDALTGAGNRRAFDRALQIFHQDHIDHGSTYAVAMFDLDHFKRINDSFGHSVGDLALSIFGKLLIGNVREGDVAARYGGEEFAVLFPKTKRDEAAKIAERIRATLSIKRMVIRATGQQVGTITVSSGVAEIQSGETPKDLLDRADKALYVAKSGGRNQVKTA